MGATNDIDNVLKMARLLLMMMDEQENLATVLEGPKEPSGELKYLQQQITGFTAQVA